MTAMNFVSKYVLKYLPLPPQNEAMTGTHTQNPVYSRITLALMEDTGWYRANYHLAQPLKWGRHLGCTFAMSSCKEYMEEQTKKQVEFLFSLLRRWRFCACVYTIVRVKFDGNSEA